MRDGNASEKLKNKKLYKLKNLYFVEGLGYAKYKDDDAFVARHVIEKNDIYDFIKAELEVSTNLLIQ